MSDGYFYLCCNCGTIAPADMFAALKLDLDSGEIVDAGPDDYDPILRCPLCKHDHRDGDYGPGLYDGTYAVCAAARESEVRDGPGSAVVESTVEIWARELLSAAYNDQSSRGDR